MKLYYNKDNAGVGGEKAVGEEENIRRGEFDKIDQKLKTKKIGPFASALLGAITAFSLSFQACSSHDVAFDGGDADAVDAKNDGDAGTDAGDEVADDAWDGGDEKDGGTDAGDEIDGGLDGADEVDGGTDGGDETVVDGGDQTGDQQTCEPRTDCTRTQEGEFALFTINGEEIKEIKEREVCVATAEDCSTSVTNESLVLTLSRPLTPEEQQLFMTQHVSSALGVTTMYSIFERQVGNEAAYDEKLAIYESIMGFTCTHLSISADGITAVALSQHGGDMCIAYSNGPAVQCGTSGYWIKVYSGGDEVNGVPVAILSDVKLAEHGQPVEVDGVEYYAVTEVDPANNDNLAGMRLEKNQQATCGTGPRCKVTEANPVTLFTVNSEEINEAKITENCVQVADNCAWIVSERISITLSRPLTPEEQQLFLDQRVQTALGITTLYTPQARQFGNQAEYVEHLTCPGFYVSFFCVINGVSISPEGVTRVSLYISGSDSCIAYSNGPAVQCGTSGYWIKVYPGGDAINGVPVVFLSDGAMAEHGQSIQMNGKEYSVTIEVEQGNQNNVARTTLYWETSE